MRKFLGRSVEADPGGNGEKEEQQTRYLSVESAAEMIDSLPSDVPRESQLHIVREAFAAAGIDVSTLERNTRTRAAQLSSEIELVRNRQKELREKTEEIVRGLEAQIRTVQAEIMKVQEAFDAGLAEEEEKISPPMGALEDVRRVRAFFAFLETEDVSEEDDVPETDGEENPTPRVREVHAKGAGGVKGKGLRQARY
jgi:hypothetical protein